MSTGDMNNRAARSQPKGDPSAFAEELARWRVRRGFSKKVLARAMGFDPSYVSHVEHGRHAASEDFARRAEVALSADGAIWRAWQTSGAPGPAGSASELSARSGLIVESDEAELRYAGGVYRATQRRRLHNAGDQPVTRYLMRISVDRFPGQPERSNRLYRERPLRWEELDLSARCDEEPMTWRAKQDRDSFKEVWLCFENEDARFPLYPGEHVTLEYAYSVDDGRWGPWFQRAVRLPTKHLSVRLVFPAAMHAKVWGTETSMTAEAVPLRTPIARRRSDENDVFSWSTADPPLHARYRLEWRFGAHVTADHPPVLDLRRVSDRMRAAGIVQRGDPVLHEAAQLFALPGEAAGARDVIERLFATMQRVGEHHVFGKGMGLAAPQIGVPRAVAIVQPPGDSAEPIVLVNPRIVGESTELDEQFEGCLSFFDVRGLVPRPLRLEVEHASLNGEQLISVYDAAVARLVAHEVDHLRGRLYPDRMRPGVDPIPLDQYRGSGQPWTYQDPS